MSVDRREPRRFDPVLHADLKQYIGPRYGQDQGILREHQLRASLALGGLFNPLAETIHTRLTEAADQRKLPIPEVLSGSDPIGVTLSNDGSGRGRGGLPIDIGIAQFSRAYYSGTQVIDGQLQFNQDITIPVGKYGRDVTLAVIQSIRAMYVVVPDLIRDQSEIMSKSNREFLFDKTFFHNPTLTVTDSINSLGQAFMVLVNAGRIQGYEKDPVGLFRGLVDAKTFNQLSSLLALGDLARMNRYGVALKGALNPDTLRLKPSVRDSLLRALRARPDQETDWRATNLGCPVARENTPVVREDGSKDVIGESGINLIARVFALYLEHYYSELKDKAS